MSDKPSYLGLLNAISLGESEAECYLNAWAAVTTDPGVRKVVSTVALREGEHGKAFAKRMCELGYEVLPREGGDASDKMAIAASTTLSDREKFERLGLGKPVRNTGEDDVFSRMFRDTTIDIPTGTLLGRYVSEERDSGRMLAGCYSELCAQANGSLGGAPVSASVAAGLEARLGRIEEQLECLMTQLAART
jgi:hypothetical protein